MPEDLKDAHIQDIADILSGEYHHEELTEILRRFDAEHLRFNEDEAVDDITHVSRYNRVAHWLRESNGTPLGRKLLAHLVENTQLRVNQLEALEDSLAGSRFVLSETDDGLKLMLRISATAEKEMKDQRGYIEEQAPDSVMEKIEAAEDKLTEGEPDNALQSAVFLQSSSNPLNVHRDDARLAQRLADCLGLLRVDVFGRQATRLLQPQGVMISKSIEPIHRNRPPGPLLPSADFTM